MRERTINEILHILRTEKGISQEKLCRGLCLKGTYSKYESGERLPDRLLLNMLIQRMGKSPDKLSTVLTIEEYQYFLWKKRVLCTVGKKQIELLKKLLEKPEGVDIVIHLNLQKQFICRMQAYVAWKEENDIDKSIKLLQEAVGLTMPGLDLQIMKKYMISVEEMHILLELSWFLIQGGQKEEAAKWLWEITVYVDGNFDDYEAKVKVYPRAVKLLYPILLQHHRKMEGVLLCRKAVELLRWQGVLYDLVELMEGYLECHKGFPETEEAIHFQRQLWALKEVYQEYKAEQYLTEENRLFYSNQEIYLMEELIKRSRVNKGMSQEVLSEGICTPENLSRIERGKGAPNTRNFRALMEKLQVEQDYYNGRLDTNDFLLLEKQKELEREISLANWKEANILIAYLKEKVDMSSLLNQKILKMFENCVLFFEGRMKPESFLMECEKALGCEEEGWKKEHFWKQFFTGYEATLLTNIAVAYNRMNQREKSIFILEHLLEELKRSKVRLSDRYVSSMTVICNLSSYYGEAGMYKECMEMCELGINLCLESGRGVRLSRFLGNKAEAMNDEARKRIEKSEDYLKKAYYISDLMLVHSSTAYIEQYYCNNYNEKIVWYYESYGTSES